MSAITAGQNGLKFVKPLSPLYRLTNFEFFYFKNRFKKSYCGVLMILLWGSDDHIVGL